MKLIVLFIALMHMNAFALTANCDCDVRIFSPLTGSLKLEPTTFKTYELEVFSSYSVKNQNACRESCLKEFEKDMPSDRLNALLVNYGQGLIDKGVLGYNCTGLTTLKFPVRVKAKLGNLSLGNVTDFIQVVTHEQICF
jgi:hypothetical protein